MSEVDQSWGQRRYRNWGRIFSEKVSESGQQNCVGNRSDGTNSQQKLVPESGLQMGALSDPLALNISQVDGLIPRGQAPLVSCSAKDEAEDDPGAGSSAPVEDNGGEGEGEGEVPFRSYANVSYP